MFFKELAAWYCRNLCLPVAAGETHATLASAASEGLTVWPAFPAATAYFGDEPSPFMLNYKVRDL